LNATTPPTAPARPGRYAQLDGLRGLAALMVVLSHFMLALEPGMLSGAADVHHFPGGPWIARSPLIFFWNPELGVAIFFVLSGFVLAATTAARPAPWGELALRRWIRLSLPVLGTSLLIWPIAAAGLFYSVPLGAIAKSSWLSGQYAWLSFAQPRLWLVFWQSLIDLYARRIDYWNAALWTMPTEFWGSLGLFAAYAVLRRFSRRPWTGVAVAVAAAAVTWQSQYLGFALGALLFEALHPRPARPLRRFAVLGGVLGVAGFLLGGTPYVVDHSLYWHPFLWLAPFIANPVYLMHRIGAFCLVGAALLSPPLRWVLTTRPLQFLGRVSFMLYLCHVPILASIVSWIVLRLIPLLGYGRAAAVGLVTLVAISLAVARLLTRLLDQPAMRLSHQWGAAGPRGGAAADGPAAAGAGGNRQRLIIPAAQVPEPFSGGAGIA